MDKPTLEPKYRIGDKVWTDLSRFAPMITYVLPSDKSVVVPMIPYSYKPHISAFVVTDVIENKEIQQFKYIVSCSDGYSISVYEDYLYSSELEILRAMADSLKPHEAADSFNHVSTWNTENQIVYERGGIFYVEQ